MRKASSVAKQLDGVLANTIPFTSVLLQQFNGLAERATRHEYAHNGLWEVSMFYMDKCRGAPTHLVHSDAVANEAIAWNSKIHSNYTT